MDTKPWWQSKTIWGAIIATIATVLKLFKVNVDLPPDLTDQILNAVTLVGTILAIIGRVNASKVISSQPPINPNSPLMRLILLTSVLCLLTSGCATGPVYSASPLAAVGSDFQANAADALQAYAEYKAGNVSMTWALMKMFNAYSLSAKTSTDVQALIKAWIGGTGDGKTLADRLARIFNASTAPPETKMKALAQVTQTVAANKGP